MERGGRGEAGQVEVPELVGMVVADARQGPAPGAWLPRWDKLWGSSSGSCGAVRAPGIVSRGSRCRAQERWLPGWTHGTSQMR